MSEYQYYEFQAIDRPLTEEEQRAVSRLSSRVDPHPRQAVFVYHYSDLPADERELLVKYYDAMFYIANWGTTRLMFRFPQALIDVRQIEPYCVEDAVTYETIGEYVVLDIFWNDEGGEYSDWVEGDGFLDGLISLREAILRQDYRVLYLAWLSAFHTGMMEEDEVEPPVPPGLQKLTPALRRFMEAFHVDEALVAAAAKASPATQTPSPTALRQAITSLPREVCDELAVTGGARSGSQFVPVVSTDFCSLGRWSNRRARANEQSRSWSGWLKRNGNRRANRPRQRQKQNVSAN